MLPEDPRSKYDQRVKTLSMHLQHLLPRLLPPLSKGDGTWYVEWAPKQTGLRAAGW